MQIADRLASLSAAAKSAADRAEEARTALETERAEECCALASFDADGADASLERASRAQIRRARAERVHAARCAEVEDARHALAAAQTDAQRALYERATRRLDGWEREIRGEVEELVALDRELADVVERVADRVADAEEVWREASDLSRAIGEEHVFKARFRAPTLATAQYVARVGIAVARTREERGDFDHWIEGEPLPGLHEEQQTWKRAAAIFAHEEASHAA